ncbi:MAG: DUF5060 domain-containing protein, partial [Chitinispirillaceae bacterium]
MEKLFQGSYRSVRCCITLMVLAATCLSAAPTITQVTPNATSVGKYALLELTVSLTATYTNAYDPTEVALSAVFTAPSGKTWTINGFYDGSLWKVRFAANETGTWNYVVKLTDATGSTQSASQNFSCTASSDHGWVKVAPNNRYLCCDDGTSFYGIGMAYCWSVTEGGLSALGADKCNTWVYWNGTYDGYNLIESPSSGIGKYDQAKCARIDDLLSWSEASGMKMILVLWPHDYLLSHADGSWTDNWSLNAYQSIVSCADFYSDATSWAYQAKQYQYDIARWGYSTALLSWQLIDEISGTEGYMDDATTANAWAAKIATFFQTNDPFHHPTESSLGGYWTQGDAANTMTNTENYGDESATGWASLAQQLWNGYDKPAMTGEAGGGDCNTTSIFSAMANGECINPMFWQYNQGTNSSADLAIFPGFAAFVNSINFAGLTNLALAKVTVSGATAYGVSSDQDVFGWITGTVSGKTLSITGLANNGYNSLEWWDCTAGTHTTSAVSATNGTLTATIPTTSEGDIAFQLTSPTAVIARSLPAAENYKPLIAYRQGALRLLEPLTGG